MNKPVYEIDGEKISTLEEFFEEISRVLIPGISWGKNLDAFNDILRGGFGTPEMGFILKWKNSDLSKEKLGYAETVRQIEKKIQFCHSSNKIHLLKDLERAKNGAGPTVYERLLEIICIHCRGGDEEEDGVELLVS